MPGGVPDTSPRFSLNWSPKVNYIEKVGDLPKYIASVATALIQDAGMSREHAIATAVNTVRSWCKTGHARNLKGNPKLSPAVHAEACKQIADWDTRIKKGGGGRKGPNKPGKA
jgi:hypothetical protein